MEKLLRYLNPKSVNFDAMPSGGVPSLTAADVCIISIPQHEVAKVKGQIEFERAQL